MRTVKRGRRSRRGFTLILMTLLLTVFVGAAAFATDFGKMYFYRAQLQAAADAGALAGIFQVAQGGSVESRDTAKAYTARHKVGTAIYDSSTAVVTPGTWNQTGTPQFDPTTVTGWGDPKVDAVRVIVRFTGAYGFGRLFGFTSRLLVDTAVAVRGAALSASCVRPFAVPYQSLLNQLYPVTPTDSSKFKNAATYNLSQADVDSLRAAGIADTVALKVGDQPTDPGQFYVADLPPRIYADGYTSANPWSGAKDYKEASEQSCADLAAHMTDQVPGHPPYVSVGDYLAAESGKMQGPTKAAVDSICGPSHCSPPIKILAAMWDVKSFVGVCNGGGGCYHVKYIGAFALTGYDNSSKSVNGYFTSMAVAGAITPGATSPVQTVGLVK